MEGSSTNVYPYRRYCCRRYTEPEGNLCRVPDVLQNSQKCRVWWYNCHRTHKSVGYCIQNSQGILCGVPDLLQNSQKCRVLWCNCHRTHRSIGYRGTGVTELTEVLCRVKTEGNYPRYRSVGTLQNSSVEKCFVFRFWHPMLVRPAMKRLFCLMAKNTLGRFAPSALPHY